MQFSCHGSPSLNYSAVSDRSQKIKVSIAVLDTNDSSRHARSITTPKRGYKLHAEAPYAIRTKPFADGDAEKTGGEHALGKIGLKTRSNRKITIVVRRVEISRSARVSDNIAQGDWLEYPLERRSDRQFRFGHGSNRIKFNDGPFDTDHHCSGCNVGKLGLESQNRHSASAAVNLAFA